MMRVRLQCELGVSCEFAPKDLAASPAPALGWFPGSKLTIYRMPARRLLTRALLAVATVVLAVGAVATSAHAHSLDSSTVSIHQSDSSVDATISLALETLDEALGTDYATATDVDTYADNVIDYIDEHLTVIGADGTVWAEAYSNPVSESVEGIESFSVDVVFDTAGASTDDFTIAYDAIIEAVSGHEAVVVLTDANGDVSTPGIIDAAGGSITIGETSSVAIADMVEYGFHHVLEGADHLLFLTVLLLPAPMLAIAGRWRRRDGIAPTVKQVVHVITAFTIGHSLTLVASTLGWISLPSQPVEILVGASVGVSAIHAIRPLTRRGEQWIAFAFGLVHGLAFAGILTDLGLEGRTSLAALGAFNVGVELAQLATAALVFPSLYLLSKTRAYPTIRFGGALLALAAATGWVVDRLELAESPLDGLEEMAITHPWHIVIGLAAFALTCTVLDRWRSSPRVVAA